LIATGARPSAEALLVGSDRPVRLGRNPGPQNYKFACFGNAESESAPKSFAILGRSRNGRPTERICRLHAYTQRAPPSRICHLGAFAQRASPGKNLPSGSIRPEAVTQRAPPRKNLPSRGVHATGAPLKESATWRPSHNGRPPRGSCRFATFTQRALRADAFKSCPKNIDELENDDSKPRP